MDRGEQDTEVQVQKVRGFSTEGGGLLRSTSTVDDPELQEILTQMITISEVAASALRPVVRGGERNNAPRGPSRTMAEAWCQFYLAAPDDEEARKVVIKARVALAKAKRAHRPSGLTGEQLDEYLLEVYKGDPAEEVATVEGCSARHVERLRSKHGLQPSSGLKV